MDEFITIGEEMQKLRICRDLIRSIDLNLLSPIDPKLAIAMKENANHSIEVMWRALQSAIAERA